MRIILQAGNSTVFYDHEISLGMRAVMCTLDFIISYLTYFPHMNAHLCNKHAFMRVEHISYCYVT